MVQPISFFELIHVFFFFSLLAIALGRVKVRSVRMRMGDCSQNTSAALNVDKAAEAEKQAKGLELLESRVKALEAERQGKDSLEALEKRLKELEAETSKQGKNWDELEKRSKEIEGGNQQQQQGKSWDELERLKALELQGGGGGGGGMSDGMSGSNGGVGSQSDGQVGRKGDSRDGGFDFSNEELSEKIKQLEAQVKPMDLPN